MVGNLEIPSAMILAPIGSEFCQLITDGGALWPYAPWTWCRFGSKAAYQTGFATGSYMPESSGPTAAHGI